MDSSYESERSLSKATTPDESDIETQLFNEQEGSKLAEEKEKLQKEIDVIRVQFDQAMQVTKNMDAIHHKNQKLVKALRAIQSENDELQRKLEISQSANDEITSKFNEEKIAFSQQRQHDAAEREKELSKTKKDYEKKIEELQNALEELTAGKEKSDLQNKMLRCKIDRLLNSSSHFFCLTIPDIDALIELISNSSSIPPAPPPQAEQQPINFVNNDHPVINNFDEKILLFQKKFKINRQKLKQAKKQNISFQSEINLLKREISDKEKKQNSITQEYEAKIKHIKEDYTMKLTDSSEQNKKLIEKVNSLKAEMQNLKSELKEFRLQKIAQESISVENQEFAKQTVNNQKDANTNHLAGYNEEIESLKMSNSEITQKLQETTEKNNQLLSRIKDLESENNRFEIESENYKNKFDALQTAHSQTLLEVETLRQTLHSKPDPKPHREEHKLARRMKLQNDRLEQTIKTLNAQIHDLSVENEGLKRNENNLHNQLQSIKDDLEESQQRNSSLSDELNDTKQQLHDKPVLTADDIIPPYAWSFSEFDKDLTTAIQKIVLNPLLQPASKLNTIYKTINKHFTALLNQKDTKEAELDKEFQSLKETFNQFIVELCIVLQVPSMPKEEFTFSNASQIVIQKIKDIIQLYENEKRKNAQISLFIDHFTAEFGHTDPVDLHAQVNSIRSALDSQSKNIKIRSKQCRALRKVLRTVKQSTSDEIANLNVDLSDLTTVNDQLKAKINDLSLKNSQLKRELQISKNRIRELQTASDEKEQSLREELENEIQESKVKYTTATDELQGQIKRLIADKDKSAEIVENNEKSIVRLKNVIEQDRKTISEKNDRLKELQLLKDNEIEKLQAKSKAEKEQIISSYEKAVSEIKRQCDEHRSDLEKVSQELALSLKKRDEAKIAIIQLKREKLKLESKIQSMDDQMKREKQLAEASAKTQIIASEENLNQKMIEAKNKWENEKRRIFSYAQEEFRSYYDKSDTMDERSFKNFLGRIKKELERLTDSDSIIRRLVCAEPRQTTDDAVAQFIMP